MRGHPVTEREVNNVLRLIHYRTSGGERVHTRQTIAALLDLDPRTIEEIIWLAAEREGVRAQWRTDPPEDP